MLTKKVDGRVVELTEAEEADIRAKWQENARTPPPASRVREEALRQINEVADGRTRDQLMQRALRLIMKVAIEGGTLTAEDQAEIAAGKQQADKVEAIQAVERQLLAADPIPADYADQLRAARQ